MSESFVKIYGEILDSSIWAESSDTRIVWITMLAMADADGYVACSRSGLMRRAVVSAEALDVALAVLEAPDPDDRSGIDGGRRIRKVQGGWRITTARIYRERRSDGAERTAAWRRRKEEASSQNVTTCDGVTSRDAEVEAEADSGVGVVGGSEIDPSAATANYDGDRSEIARAPANEARTSPALVKRAASLRTRDGAREIPGGLAVTTTTRSGRTYVGRQASSSEIAEVDLWRREAAARLTPQQRARVPTFTRDFAELAHGLSSALDEYGEKTVRDVVTWAVLECGAGRLSPKHFRALFNGDAFSMRVVEASAHIAGEAADLHGVSPELAAAIAKVRTRVQNNRDTLAMDPDDEAAPPADIRASIELELQRDEAQLAELLGASRKRHA